MKMICMIGEEIMMMIFELLVWGLLVARYYYQIQESIA